MPSTPPRAWRRPDTKKGTPLAERPSRALGWGNGLEDRTLSQRVRVETVVAKQSRDQGARKSSANAPGRLMRPFAGAPEAGRGPVVRYQASYAAISSGQRVRAGFAQ